MKKTTIILAACVLLTGAFLIAMQVARQRSRHVEHFAFADGSRMCNNKFVWEIPNFLTPQQCDVLRRAALDQGMQDSMVGEQNQSLDTNVRMSKQAWLKYDANEVTRLVTQKALDLVNDLQKEGCFRGVNVDLDESVSREQNFEDIQVVRYEPKGKYDPHYDGTECGEDTESKECLSNQRVATLLVYLNDDYQGGHTRFPNLDNMRVKPERGKAVFFWVSDPVSGYVYKETLHGGDPVSFGEKWIATQWIRRNKKQMKKV